MRQYFVFGTLAILAVLTCQADLVGQIPAASVAAQQTLSDSNYQPPSEIPWTEDLATAQARAAKENKYVLLHFWGAQCRPCLRLEKFVFNNPQVIRAIDQNVIPVKVQDARLPELFVKYGVRKMPQDVIITPEGKILMKRPSPSNIDGYMRIMSSVRKQLDKEKKTGQEIVSKDAADHIETVRKRDAELRQKLAQQQQKQFLPNADGIVYNRNPIAPQYHPNSSKHPQSSVKHPNESVGVAKVSDPSVQSPTHEMPQIDPDIVAQLKNSRHESETNPKSFKPLVPAGSKQQRGTVVRNEHLPNQQTAPVETATGEHSSKIRNVFANRKKSSPKQQSFVPAMDGYCPVTLINEQKFARGDKNWGCFHRGKLFLFTSKKYRDQFMSDPDTYFPALAGMDPVVFAQQGREVTSGIVTGLVANHQNRKLLILFSSIESKQEFIKEKDRYIQSILQLEAKKSVHRTAQQPFDSKIR